MHCSITLHSLDLLVTYYYYILYTYVYCFPPLLQHITVYNYTVLIIHMCTVCMEVLTNGWVYKCVLHNHKSLLE